MGRQDWGDVQAVTFGSPRARSVEAGGLLVTDVVFPAGAYIPPHIHDRTCVATTLAGSFDSRMRGRSHWSESSMFLTEPLAERHDNRIGAAGARVLIVQPDAARLELLRPFAPLLDAINHRSDVQVALVARRLCAELGSADPLTPLAVEGLALELVAAAARAFESRASDAAPAWCRRVRDRLHDAPHATPGLAELAALAGVHPGHLTREFRRQYRCSIGEYQRARRLDRAARLLTGGEESIASIAIAAGFADQSHFTRVFRRQFGCTPGAYRARARLTRRQGD